MFKQFYAGIPWSWPRNDSAFFWSQKIWELYEELPQKIIL